MKIFGAGGFHHDLKGATNTFRCQKEGNKSLALAGETAPHLIFRGVGRGSDLHSVCIKGEK